MGQRILAGRMINEAPGRTGAVLYCSTSMTALPWIFESESHAVGFVNKYGDIRSLSYAEQQKLYAEWISG